MTRRGLNANTLGELLVELRTGEHAVPPILVAVNALPDHGEGGRTLEQTLSTTPMEWALRVGEEYADGNFLLLDNAERPGASRTVKIGRSRSCDVYIPAPSVSAHHATLELNLLDNEFVLLDEGSRNGTYVNGVRLAERARTIVWTGAYIGFGSTLFVFLDPATLRKLATLTGKRR